MATPDAPAWTEENQSALVAALAVVRELLEAPSLDGRRTIPPVPTLDILTAAFGLSGFERSVLLLAAGAELDAGIGRACASAIDGDAPGFPTWSLALAALPDPHWSALSPDAPLRRWRLIRSDQAGPLTTRPLRIAERVLHFLTGVAGVEERLAGLLEPVTPPPVLVASQAVTAGAIAQAWSAESMSASTAIPVIALGGHSDQTRRLVSAFAAAQVGLRLAATSLEMLPANPEDLVEFARLWEREAALDGQALYIDASALDSGNPALDRTLRQLLGQLVGPVVVSGREPRPVVARRVIQLRAGNPTTAEQRALWHDLLGRRATELDGGGDKLAAHFDLTADDIERAVAEALAAGSADLGDDLWSAARARARSELGQLADRLDTVVSADRLVLPAESMEILTMLVDQLRHRHTVYTSWGLADQGTRGLGISALFTGPSGTGKTMAAEVVANELALDLYRIDLSGVVSKYIGETEKNVRRVFDAAEQGGGVLFFDEADALFGRRSEVRDSHDRYANIEVNYLLQRMESYRGIAILATNAKGAIDPAFLRRIRFVVSFPIPSVESRIRMWRQVFPAACPTEGLVPERLGQLAVTGGNIRSIAVNAAFLAAADGGVVTMGHVLRATRAEFSKLERPLPDSEIRTWV